MIVLNCQLCGEPMPPIDNDTDEGKEMMKLLLKGGVELKHDICPDERDRLISEAPKLRRFEARVRLVEVIAPEVEGGDATLEELAGFTAYVDAANFAGALRPLAENLGERWMQVEKHALIADVNL